MADEKSKWQNFVSQVTTGWNTVNGIVTGADDGVDAIESWMKTMLVCSITANVIAATTLVVMATKKSK